MMDSFYFTYDNLNLKFAMHPYSGDPDMYVTCKVMPILLDEYKWSSV